MKPTKPVTLEHTRLRQLSERLRALHPEDVQILELANALQKIGCGHDANDALGVKRGKGQDDKKAETHYKTEIAIRWIAGRLNPVVEDSRTPTKTAAIQEAAASFELDVENLTRACPNLKELSRLATFDWDSQRPRIKKPED